MKEIIEKLISGSDLTEKEMLFAFDAIMKGRANDVEIGSFLVALRAKGEKPEEIASAASAMRSMATRIELDFDVVDTCGTGGDKSYTFNISTAVAFVLAGAGLKVAKHGNRSISSSSGSADCLEALGVPIDLEPEDAARAIRNNGFAFLMAPRYHPGMKHAMPARKKLGIRTLFNILGPLCNPAGASYQVLGVYSKRLVEPMAKALSIMGVKGAMVVHGGLDEVSIAGPTYFARVLPSGIIGTGYIVPGEVGIDGGTVDDLRVNSARESADIIERAFAGSLKGPCLDSIILNAAAGFMAVDSTMDIMDGMDVASKVIGRGEAMRALELARSA